MGRKFFGETTFIRSSGGGSSSKSVTNSLRLSDINVKTSTDESGKVNDPSVYEREIERLQNLPNADDARIQLKIAEYQNQRKALMEDNVEQEVTLGNFKRELENDLFDKNVAVRDPKALAHVILTNLEAHTAGVMAEVERLDSRNKKYDQIQKHLDEVTKLTSAQRDLVNAMDNDQLSPNMDGYGYFVRTNPLDGTIVGASVLPVAYAPKEVTEGMKRIEHQSVVGSVSGIPRSLPVYLPTVTNSDGVSMAMLGAETWSGTGNLPLSHESGAGFDDAGFNIQDEARFQTKRLSLSPGQFGKKFSHMQDGIPKYSYYFKGADQKAYALSEEELPAVKADPMMSKQLSGYVPYMGEDDVRGLGKVEKFKPVGLEQRIDSGIAYGPPIPAAQPLSQSVQSSAYPQVKNTPNVPEKSKESSGGRSFAGDIIEKGKQIFRNVMG